MPWIWGLVVVMAAATSSQAQEPPGTSGTFTGVVSLDVVANLGQVSIEAWTRPDVQIDARHSDRVKVEIKGGPVVEIREHRPPRASLERVDYTIRVPAETRIELWSQQADVAIRGVLGDIDVHGQHGTIAVTGVGTARLNTTTGDINVSSARGSVRIESTAGSITAGDLAGDVEAETVGGTINLSNVSGETVRVTSTGAAIEVAGRPQPGGVYDIASQAGAVTLRLPPDVDARISYGTVRGRFQTNLPEGHAVRNVDGRTTLTVGGGRSRIEIITFSGDITVLAGPSR